MVEKLESEQYYQMEHAYAKSRGKVSNEYDKKWPLDVDYTDEMNEDNSYNYIEDILDVVRDSEPINNKLIHSNYLGQIPSKSGIHLITKPFDTSQLAIKLPEISIHKDNPTNLYIP